MPRKNIWRSDESTEMVVSVRYTIKVRSKFLLKLEQLITQVNLLILLSHVNWARKLNCIYSSIHVFFFLWKIWRDSFLYVLMITTILIYHFILNKVLHDIHRYREHNGAVVLCWYVTQGLQIPQLKYRVISGKRINEQILTCRAEGQSLMVSAACLSALLALCSPSAAITLARASLAASASAAMALCSCSGTRTSFTSTRSTLTPQGSVASSSVS